MPTKLAPKLRHSRTGTSWATV